MKKKISILLAMLFIVIMSACSRKKLHDVIPTSTTYELSHGASIYGREGTFPDTVKIEIYAPNKISSLSVNYPYEKDYLNIDLAEKSRSFLEEQVQKTFLNGKTYLNVKGNLEATVILNKKVLNDLEVGKHFFSFTVIDERKDVKNQDITITVMAKKNRYL